MAYGIGANDVANAFATSVGSRTLKLKWAIAIAVVRHPPRVDDRDNQGCFYTCIVLQFKMSHL
jgi:Phosphate transporter family